MTDVNTATTVATLEAGDHINFIDSSDSNRLKKAPLSGLPIRVASDAAGKNLASGTDVNSIVATVHSSTVLGGGTVGRENIIGSATHSTHTDPDYPAPTLPNYATVIGSYDQLNNQQATLLACPHSFAPAEGLGTGHNAALGGSWSKVGGSYNAVVGGGGGEAFKNETTVNANCSAIIGGIQNLMDAQYSAIVGGVNNTVDGDRSVVIGGGDHTNSSIGSVILGGATAGHSIDASSDGSVVLGGRNLETIAAPYSVTIGQDAVSRIRSAFVQATDSIVADGDAQSVRWVGRAAGAAATLDAYISSSSNSRFGSYGTAGGMWGGTVTVMYRDTSNNVGHFTGQVLMSWPAGGSSVVEAQTWTAHVNEAGLANPFMGTASLGNIFARLTVSTQTQMVVLYDGVMTHW